MKKTGLLGSLFLWSIVAFAQNPLTPEQLWKLGRVSGLGLSKDGRFVVYAVSTPNAETNKSVRKTYRIPLAGGLAVIPAMAAREVAVSALQTVYAIDAEDEDAGAQALGTQLSSRWSLATALAFLASFVFAPQCLSTIAVVRRETGGWRWPAVMLGYLFALAYGAAGATYWIAVAAGLG